VLPDAQLRLIVFAAGAVESHVVPKRGELVLGRGSEADVTIEHVTVSRRHATLRIGETLEIVDLGSHNGTRIGGKRLAPNTPTPIDIATIAELGGTMIVVQLDTPDTVVATRSGGAVRKEPERRPELSEAMLHLYRLVDNVAESNISVVVRGETGAGKEVVAEEIHKRSARASGPLVKLNCAALPEHLLEAELFGYERGAFTGATAAKPGLVESADGGTLFLDEIGELPLATQAKLLRMVETREVMRLGSLRSKAVDLRLVSATHRDLESMILAGTFREDLYYRINGVSLFIPPLRERVSEIATIANALVMRFCKESKRPTLPITEAALAALKGYPWPGNVRELRNVIERAIVFCRSVAIGPEHLGLPGSRSIPPLRPISSTPEGGVAMSASPSALPPVGATAVYGSGTLASAVDAVERERIAQALAQCDGNQTEAAALLGISRRTLLRRLDELKLPRPRKA
jgi:two-component system, NtrC family, response regulator AtoC